MSHVNETTFIFTVQTLKSNKSKEKSITFLLVFFSNFGAIPLFNRIELQNTANDALKSSFELIQAKFKFKFWAGFSIENNFAPKNYQISDFYIYLQQKSLAY